MPIRVSASGQTFEFPDGTSEDVIRSSLLRHFADNPEPEPEKGFLERAKGAVSSVVDSVMGDRPRKLDPIERPSAKPVTAKSSILNDEATGAGLTGSSLALPSAVAKVANKRGEDVARRAQEDVVGPEDSWSELGRKFFDRIGPLVKQSVGGIGQALTETSGYVPVGTPLSTAESAEFQGRIDEALQIARDRKLIPGQKLAEVASEDLRENGYNFGDNALKKYPAMIAESVVQMLPSIAASVATRNPSIAGLVTAGQVGGSQYAESREAGRDRGAALGDSVVMGAAEAIGEKIPVGILMKPGGKFLPKVLKAMGAESLQETFTQTVQSLYDKGVLHPEMTWGEVRQQVIDAAIVGGGMGGSLAVSFGAFDATGRIAGRRADDTRTPGPGIREQAISQAANLTPEDLASPLDNADIVAGRTEIANATAGKTADNALSQAGLPKVGSKVNVSNLPGGKSLTGTIEDVFSDENGDGVVVRPEGGGKPMREYLDTLNELGVSITPSDALAEANAIDAALAAQASAPMEVSSPLPSAGAEVAPSSPSGRTPSASAGGATNFDIGSYMARVRQAESGGKDNAKAGTSSATGRYQFTDGTWLTTYKAVFGNTGENDAQILAKRGDGAVQDRLMQKLTQDNAAALRAAGLPVNDTTLYLAHFAGVGGARSILKVAPDRSVETVLGKKAVAANSFLKGKTAGEVIAWAAGKMGAEGGGGSGTVYDGPSLAAEKTDWYEPPAEQAEQKLEVTAPAPELPQQEATSQIAEGNEIRRVRIGDIVQFAEHQAGTDGQEVSSERAAERERIRDYIKSNGSLPGGRPLIEIDTKRGTAQIRDGNHRTVLGNEIDPNMMVDVEVRRRDTKRPHSMGVPYEGQLDSKNTATGGDMAGQAIDKEWTAFAPDSGTIGIPRAEMPQVKAEHRGAMVNFLNARGISHAEEEVAADTLKPSQAEFSPSKVEKAKGYEGGNRAILISADGYVVDGHHQWLAARDKGETVRAIRLNAPIREVLQAAHEFPSSETADGATSTNTAGPQDGEIAPTVEAPKAGGSPATAADSAASAGGAVTPSPRAPIPARKDAKRDVAVTATGSEIPVDYAVVEMGDLVASNTPDGGVNPAYPADRQPRDRTRAASQTQIAEISARLNPRLLGRSPKASDGAPIISPDGIVESGNGRTLALQRVYDENGANAQAYRQFIESEGFDTAGMKQPVLVRIRDGNMSTEQVQEFVRAANVRDTAGMSGTETAGSDAAAMPTQIVDLYRGGDIEAAGNRDFVKAFVNALVPTNERASMILADGSIAKGLVARMEAALLVRAFGQRPFIEKMVDATDSNIRAIGKALVEMAGKFVKLREAAQDERVDPVMDITGNIAEAVEIIDRARREGKPIGDYVNQRDIFSGATVSQMTEASLRMFFARPDFTKPHGQAKLVSAMDFYVEEAMKAAPGGGLFGESTKATPDGILNLANERNSRTQPADADLFSAARQPGAVPDGESVPDAGRDGGLAGEGLQTLAREEGGSSSEPVEPTDPADTPAANTPARIDDFGEQLVGARKDVWQSYKDRLNDAAEVDVTAEPLSKTWPEPDYQKLLDFGADPYVVAWVHAARDEIPTKPQKGWKLKGWAENVRLLRDTATKLLNDEIGADALVKRMSGELSRSLRDLQGRVDLYRDMGHSKSLKGITFSQNYYSLYRGERDVTKWVVEKRAKATAFGNWPREIAVGDTREEALAKFKAIYDAGNLDGKQDKIVRFDIYSRRGELGFMIGKKIGKDHVDLKRFGTAKEARDFKISDAGYAELVAALEQYKDIPPERKASNAPRIGIDHRSGADVTPEAFAEAFGFRGVQFGNYVEGERRQSDLNEAYDALMDLAGVIGIPARALSLNGELGLAFGARGKGGKGAAAAHFEPDTIVINLTKNKGAGSLAHEWWHSLDNYFSRMRAPGGYMTEGKITATDGVRPEMVQAFKDVMTALRSTSLKERSKNLDKRRTKEYWATDIEMSARAFESYVIAKLQDEQFSNDYLANVVSEKAFGIEDGYPYLRAAEIPPVRAAFDEFFNTVETRETERGLALFSTPEASPKTSPNTSPTADVREALREQLANLRLADKVKVRLVDTLGGAAGEYRAQIVTIAQDTPQGEAFTLNHEAIHVLRDLGLFNTSEWAILSAKARRETGLMRSIRQRYEAGFRERGMSGPALQEALLEEAVADMFARHQDGRYKAEGTTDRLFKMLRQFFEAVRNAFAGRGLRTAEGVMQDVAAGQIGGRNSVGIRGGDVRQMVVWHGSPHEFDQFTLDAIGTGEGAQAYGWGLYFAGRKEVAEHYRRALALKPLLDKIEIDSDVYADEAVATVRKEGRLTEKEADLLDALEADDFLGFDYLHQAIRAAFREPENFDLSPELVDAIRNQGRLYQVDIPEEGEFLLWDKPLSEQSSQVQAAIGDAFEFVGFDRDGVTMATRRGDVEGFDVTGNEFYDWFSKELNRRGAEPDSRGARRADKAASIALREAGIAGIKYLDGTSRKAGEGSFNYVLFDDARAQVMAKLSIPEDLAAESKNAIPTPLGRVQDFASDEQRVTSVRTMLGQIGNNEESRWRDTMDAWRVRLQDKMLPVLRLQDRIAQAMGREIAEAENAYLSEEVMTGRAGARLERLSEEIIEPLIGAMNDSNVSLDELETYLYARHAPERNARIAKINPEFSEGEGSGMTDLEAAAVMSRVAKSGKKEQIEALAALVDKMLGDALQTRIDAGLISKEEAAAWSDTYKHYVPLRGRIEVEGDVEAARMRVQSGLTVKGKESKRAFGRRSKADNILSYAILQAEEAIIRAEKNGVAQAFLRLAQANPNPDFWQVNKIERRPVFNEASGLVRYENQSRISADDAPFTVTAKVDGNEFHVTMDRTNPEAVRVATAMRNLDDPKFNKFMAAASSFNRYFSAINTRFNPSFVVTNMLRDVETAMVTLGASDVPGLRRNVLKDYVNAMTASADPQSEWGRWRREWEMAGGKVYFNQVGDLSTIRKDIELRLKMKANPSNLAKVWTRTFDAIEAVNEAVERAVRLSVFKNAREAGLSPAKAASLSRNVTTNFSRKGQWGPALNAFYAFFNASTQGSATFIRAVARSKKARRAVYGVVAAAFLAEFLNAMWSGIDDDGEKYWDKLPEFEKEKNLVLMIPGGENGEAIKIPLAYGLNAFANIGRNAAAVMRGGKSIGEAALNSATAALDAFNPMGSGGVLNMIAPTVLDPLADLYANENFAGKPIKPNENPFEPERTPSSTAFASTSPIAKAVAKAVNKATGGDEVQPGAVSLYPDDLEHIFGFLTGGSGRFVQDFAKIVTAAGDPETDLTIRDVPIVKSVVTEKAPWVDKERFYQRVQKFKAFEAHAKAYVDRGDKEGLQNLVQENLPLARMEQVTKEADKVTAKARKARREVLFALELGKVTDETARPMLKDIEAREAFAVAKYNQIWNQMMAAEDPKGDDE